MGTLWAVSPAPRLSWEKAPTSPAMQPWAGWAASPVDSGPARLLVPPGTGWHLTASAASPARPGTGGGRAIAAGTSAGCVGTPRNSPLPQSLHRESGCWEPGSSRGLEWRKSGAWIREPCKHGRLAPPLPCRSLTSKQSGKGRTLCWVPSNLGRGEGNWLIKELCRVGYEKSG